jgi:hypothetical protein
MPKTEARQRAGLTSGVESRAVLVELVSRSAALQVGASVMRRCC